ncbi:MAG: transcriptional regulator, ArsR family [Solirubrobacteraceae bacterium]|nr:transcriptional regulator, ArsR family [Solirubrobacteraceae bacterium]
MGVDATIASMAIDTSLDQTRAERVAEVAKLLTDPIRVGVLDRLRSADGQVCQCELQPLFAVSQPTLSHHLKKLADAGVVEVQRRGKWAYYSINDEALEVLRSWLS